MTSLFDIDNSSDSDDCDYEPPANALSSDEEEPLPLSDGEKEIRKKTTSRPKNSETVFETSDGSKLVSNTVEEKKKADDVYKSFLDEVAEEMKDAKNEYVSSGISCSESTSSSPVVQNAKNSCQSSTANTPEELIESIKKVIPVITVDSSSSDSNSISDCKMEKDTPTLTSTPPVSVKRKGIDSVLGKILIKKQKMTTLTKSMLDWKNFKKEEDIEEELATYNRGKGGFIERKKFLERSDVRSFEIERDMRLSKRQPKKDN